MQYKFDLLKPEIKAKLAHLGKKSVTRTDIFKNFGQYKYKDDSNEMRKCHDCGKKFSPAQKNHIFCDKCHQEKQDVFWSAHKYKILKRRSEEHTSELQSH